MNDRFGSYRSMTGLGPMAAVEAKGVSAVSA